MIYKINEYKNTQVSGAYKEGMKDFKNFFGNDAAKIINICILKNRKEIDAIKGHKTERWVNGFGTPGNNIVYILDNNSMESESSHKKLSKEEYSQLIKHEICHVFYDHVSDNCYKPLWLTEGVAYYLSGQAKKEKLFVTFSHFIKSYDRYVDSMYLYSESGIAVKLLIENFGKHKLLKLISRSKEAGNKTEFAKLFKQIYNFDLNYKNFNNLLNK